MTKPRMLYRGAGPVREVQADLERQARAARAKK